MPPGSHAVLDQRPSMAVACRSAVGGGEGLYAGAAVSESVADRLRLDVDAASASKDLDLAERCPKVPPGRRPASRGSARNWLAVGNAAPVPRFDQCGDPAARGTAGARHCLPRPGAPRSTGHRPPWPPAGRPSTASPATTGQRTVVCRGSAAARCTALIARLIKAGIGPRR